MSEVPAMISRVSAKILFAWTILAFVAFAILPARAAPGDLRLERVMLSSGGVGYFEYAAELEGDAELALKVRLDQVDDVLKFIVVYDDAGRVGQVRLPGREPQDAAFEVGITGRADPRALQGVEQRGRGFQRLGPERQVPERLGQRARAETVTLPDGLGTTVRHRVSLITPQGMRQFILEQAETIGFVDPELQAQVDEALEAIAQHRVQDSRKLSILAEGTGKRSVRVGYVIAVPLWKSSYRVCETPDRNGSK